MWFGFQRQNLVTSQKPKKLLKHLPLIITLDDRGEAKGNVHLPGPYYMPEAHRPSLSSWLQIGSRTLLVRTLCAGGLTLIITLDACTGLRGHMRAKKTKVKHIAGCYYPHHAGWGPTLSKAREQKLPRTQLATP